MDHIKKLVYIIVGCLTIVSLVFTLCHKIGHCASSGDSSIQGFYPLELPLPINSQYFGSNVPISADGIEVIKNASSVNENVIAFWDSSSDYVELSCFVVDGLEFNQASGSEYEDVDFSFRFHVSSTNIVRYYPATNTATQINTFGSGWTSYSIIYNAYSTLPNGNRFLPYNVALVHYPLWVSNGSISYNNIMYFQNYTVNSFSGHSKGGVLANYIDSDDLIDQDSSLPSVDTNPPSDTSSNSAWYQKILNGMGKINQSIKGGVLTIGDYLGQIKEDLENAIAWITEPPDSDTIMDNVEPYLAQNDLIGGFLASKSAIQGVYSSIGNVSAKTSSQMIWDIPFNLPSMSQTFHAQIDFGWYENIRSTLEPFLNMFLMVGFLFSFIRSIPGILHGNSGEGDT